MTTPYDLTNRDRKRISDIAVSNNITYVEDDASALIAMIGHGSTLRSQKSMSGAAAKRMVAQE